MLILKKYKILLSIVICAFLVIGVTVLTRKKDYSYYLVIGDYVSKNQMFDNESIPSFSHDVGEYLKDNKLVSEVQEGYLNNNMTSKKLLEMIENDAYMIDDISLSDEIKRSKYITITLGINDIINDIKYDKMNDSLIYNKDVINDKIDIFKHNYFKVIEEIKNINDDVNIMLVGVYCLYNDMDVFLTLNSAIEEVASYYNLSYIDLSDIKDSYLYLDNSLYLNSLGQEMISNKIILKIKETN